MTFIIMHFSPPTTGAGKSFSRAGGGQPQNLLKNLRVSCLRTFLQIALCIRDRRVKMIKQCLKNNCSVWC
jgi:hypothetical protein